MMQVMVRVVTVLFLALFPAALSAQGTTIPFGGLKHDSKLPVEVTADRLEVNQADGSATFSGNVVIGQGDMRISAATVRVEYGAAEGDATGRISRLIASGGVTLVNGAEAAEAQRATYDVDGATVVMEGDVILTQGANALSAGRLDVNLNSGTGVLSGRVKTILQTGND